MEKEYFYKWLDDKREEGHRVRHGWSGGAHAAAPTLSTWVVDNIFIIFWDGVPYVSVGYDELNSELKQMLLERSGHDLENKTHEDR